MASSHSCSDVKMSPTCHRDQAEPHTEPKAKCPLPSDPNPVATISTHSDRTNSENQHTTRCPSKKSDFNEEVQTRCQAEHKSQGRQGPSIKPSSPYKHFIRDPNHQILVLEGGRLVAVPDKCGRHGEIFYVSALPRSAKANQITLAVSKGKRYLCCNRVKKPKRPSLELKKIKELSSLSLAKLLPFTFLKEKAGSYFTLESAANPGYFICTCSTPRQPVGVTKELGKQKNTQFEFVSAHVDVSEFEE